MATIATATIITDDGVEISRNFHRHVLTPDADISQESDEVKRIATAVFTAEAQAAYAAYVVAQQAEMENNDG